MFQMSGYRKLEQRSYQLSCRCLNAYTCNFIKIVFRFGCIKSVKWISDIFAMFLRNDVFLYVYVRGSPLLPYPSLFVDFFNTYTYLSVKND